MPLATLLNASMDLGGKFNGEETLIEVDNNERIVLCSVHLTDRYSY